MTDADTPDLTIGVLGVGAMGQGIVQVAATNRIRVAVFDTTPDAAASGIASITQRIRRLAEKGRLSEEQSAAAIANIQIIDDLSGFRSCHAVIEAVYENLSLKRELFAELEKSVPDDTILASNTSSLLVASIARDCRRRERIAGMHFFNPVPVMKLVEIVRGPDSSDQTIDFLTQLGRQMDRVPVVVKDAPGFLVNLGGRAYGSEAMRLLHERVATPAQIDAVMRDCCGFRMGPLELADMIGIDVNFPASIIIADGYMGDPRLRTSFPHRSLFEAGRLGRKTGQGSYRYDEKGRKLDDDTEEDAKNNNTSLPARIVCAIETGEPEFTRLLDELDCQVIPTDDGKSPILAALLGEDCASCAARTGADHRRLVGVDLYCNWHHRITVMTAPGSDPSITASVSALLGKTGRAVTRIQDSPGFISQRMLAMIANLGCEMAQIGIAAPKEIDIAMKLGLNYPLGPLELADHIGLPTLLTILERLQAITGEDRYRPSLWLRRRAMLRLSVYTE